MIAEDLSKEDAVDVIKRCMVYYQENGKKKERVAKFVERIGIDGLKESLGLA